MKKITPDKGKKHREPHSNHRPQWRSTDGTPRQTAKNATGRTEGTPPDQVPTDSTKSPYRAKYEATTGSTGRTESDRKH